MKNFTITFSAMILASVAHSQILPTLQAKPKTVVAHTAPIARQPMSKPAALKQDDNMVLIQGGNYNMGSNDYGPSEKPVHNVTVASFYISKFELTVAEFKKFVDETAYTTTAEQEGDSWIWNGNKEERKTGVNWRYSTDGTRLLDFEMNKPVLHISYNDAVKYCAWKSYKTGKAWRLPTEAEWEYAARGGSKNAGYSYSGSNGIDNVGWYKDNSAMQTHPVGQKQANELGLYDMTGNVWELCIDWYDDYNSSLPQNPHGPQTGSGKVMRGGSWNESPSTCYTVIRNAYGPTDRSYCVGFRPVVSF